MTVTRTAGIAAVLCAVALTGCQSSRFGALSPRGGQPEPLPATPSGVVVQSQLPAPATPQATNDPSQFPDAPQSPDVASLDPNAASGGQASPPAGAPSLSQNALVGSWNVNTGGTSCQMFLTLTSYGGGSRGGTRGCPGNLADLRIWKVSGSQLVLSDPDGTQIATLYSSGNERFDGQTSTGARISLSR